jgi:RNA polymerase sigma-70 factor (sigma-E family)
VTRPPSDSEFTELVEATWPGLYRTAYLLLGEHQLAEDLVQTALAKTYASWSKVRDPAAAAGYARVVMANTAASWFRRRSWRNEMPSEDLAEQPGKGTEPSNRPAVVAALRTLPPRQRTVVVLRYYADLSVREVADALRISEGTVKSQTSVALANLRRRLGDDVVPLTEGARSD